MGVENIIDRIIIEKEKSKKNILDESGFKCRQILADAERQAKKEKEEKFFESKKKTEEERNRRITLATLEIKKSILEEKRKIISEVYERVLEKIAAQPPPDMKKFLKTIMQNHTALAEEIIIPRRYKDVFPVFSKKEVSVKFEENLEIFIIKTAASEIRFSFKSIVDSLKENTETKVAEILFND